MSAANHANYGKIGFAVLTGFVALSVALVFIAGIGDSSGEILVETYYDTSVSGLSVGSVVNYRGVKIGEVRKIAFIGNEYDCGEGDADKVYIQMAINTQLLGVVDSDPRDAIAYQIARGLHATVASSGVTGLSRIEMSIPTSEIRDVPISWKPRDAFVPPAPSLLENFSVAATKVMNQVNRMDFTSVWSNVQTIAESVSGLSRDAATLVESQRGGIDSIIRNLDEASATAKALVGELKDNPSLLLRPNDPAPLPETAR